MSTAEEDRILSAQILPWHRMWCPRGVAPPTDVEGFFFEGQRLGGQLLAEEDITRVGCLVLLGGPGVGKSVAMRQLRASETSQPNTRAISTELRSHIDVDSLERTLFDHSIIRRWVQAGDTLRLYLDGLDESLIRAEQISELLIRHIKDYPLDRFKLRITSRVAAWSSVLEQALQSIWKDDMLVLELAPLSRSDVELAASANHLNPSAFVARAAAEGVIHLATRPLTLQFLVDAFRRNALPERSHVSLFLQASQQLLAPDHGANENKAILASQALDIAARVAAALTFCRRTAIVVRGNDPSIGGFSVEQVAGGVEGTGARAFAVSADLVEAVLSSRLFVREAERASFIHKGIQDFLAALYLVRRGVDQSVLLNLFTAGGAGGGRVYPELADAAVWLAGMNRNFFNALLVRDPQVLLRHEVATADEQQREEIVAGMLRLFDENKLTDSDWELRSTYARLDHPRIAEQLRPYIVDRTKGVVVRRVAIDIAEECGHARGLAQTLADIALDSHEVYHIRVQAAYAVAEMGDPETRKRLKQLLAADEKQDPDDQLRGCALRAMWPHLISAPDVFAALKPPRRENFFGSYQLFFTRDFAAGLQPGDLPVALQWVSTQVPEPRPSMMYRRLTSQILSRAAMHLEDPATRHAFSRAALSRLRHYLDLFGDEEDLFTEHQVITAATRRRVLEALLEDLTAETQELSDLYQLSSLLQSEDFQWVLQRAVESEPQPVARRWAQVGRQLLRAGRPDDTDALVSAAQRSPAVAETFADELVPVDLDGARADELRQRHNQLKKLQERQVPEALDPSPDARVLHFLDKFEQGDVQAWWQLNLEMTLDVTSTHYGDEFEPDLTALPAWKLLKQSVRDRLIVAARRYLELGEAHVEEWLGQNIFHRPAAAGYRALRLLQKAAPAEYRSLPRNVWEKWAPTVVGFPLSSGFDDASADDVVLAAAYAAAPAAVTQALLLMIDAENRSGSSLFIIRRFSGPFDAQLTRSLEVKLRDDSLQPAIFGELLAYLLDRSSSAAFDYASSILSRGAQDAEDKLRQQAAIVLMLRGGRRGWATVWPHIQREADFGKTVMMQMSHRREQRHEASLADTLTDAELGDLYAWLTAHFSPAEDPKHDEGAHLVSPRDSVAEFRSAVLRRLQERGTPSAVAALEHLAKQHPETGWLRWVVAEATKIMVAKQWRPPTLPEFFELVGAFPSNRLSG
jgi:hypothetical protein